MTVTKSCISGSMPTKEASPTKSKKQIIQPISEILESVDYNSFLVSKRKYKLVSELTHDLLFSNSFTDILKLRAIFSWLSLVDPCMIAFESDEPSSLLLNLLKQGAPYAQAFEALAKHLGLEVRCVRGWGKGEDYVLGEDLLSRQPNHTWNAVEIEGRWHLIDCFWSRTKDLADLDDFFFLTDPHQLIQSHYPMEQQWQLLATPWSGQQFTSVPYLKPEFFKLSLHLDPHHSQCTSPSSQSICIKHNGRVGFSFKLLSEHNHNNSDLRGHVFQEISDTCVRYSVRPPDKGVYFLHVFATNVFSGYHEKVITHKSVANFRLYFEHPPLHPFPFPRCSDACWGVPQIYRHLISPRLSTAYVVNPSRLFHFSVHKSSKEEEVYVRLVPAQSHASSAGKNQSQASSISMNQSDQKADITLEQADEGEVGLEVYVRKGDSDGKFLFFCQLLVTTTDHLHAPDDDRTSLPFPLQEVKHVREFAEVQDAMLKLRAIYKAVCNLNVDESSRSLNIHEKALHTNEKAWHDDVEVVLRFRRGLATYAEVFQYLVSACGMEGEMVEGVVRDVTNKRMGVRPHTWNIVWLAEGVEEGEGVGEGLRVGGLRKKKGLIVDCCWGARRLVDDLTRTSLVCLEDDYYFNPPPHQFIHSHLPSKASHQLLQPPIERVEFEEMAPLNPPFFQHHLCLPQPPPKHHITALESEIHLSIILPAEHSSTLEFSNSLMRYTEHHVKADGADDDVEDVCEVMQGYVLQYTSEDAIHFRVRLACSGDYRLVLFIKVEGDVFEEVLEHLVTFKGSGTPLPPFPPASLPTWGATEFSLANHIRHRGGHVVRASPQGVAELAFDVGALVNFKGILKGLQGEIPGAVLVRKVEQVLLVTVQCAVEGESTLELYASGGDEEAGVMGSKLPMYLSHQLLIHCPPPIKAPFHPNKPSSPLSHHPFPPFPLFPSHFLGPQPANNFFNVSLHGNDDHFFRLRDNRLQLTFTNQRDVRLCGKLLMLATDNSFQDCSAYVLQQNRQLVTTFHATLVSSALFVFQLFGSESSANNLLNIFNVLLHCSHLPSISSHPFPTQFDPWDGVLHQPLHSTLPLHQATSFKLQLNRPATAVVLKANDVFIDFQPASSSSPPSPSSSASPSKPSPSSAPPLLPSSVSSSPQIWKLDVTLDKHLSCAASLEVCASFSRGGHDDSRGQDGDDDDDYFTTILEYSVVDS